jgi:hypothetical protein
MPKPEIEPGTNIGKYPWIHAAMSESMRQKGWRLADLIRAMHPGEAKPKPTPSMYAYHYGRTIPRPDTRAMLAKVLDLPVETFSPVPPDWWKGGNGSVAVGADSRANHSSSNGATETVKPTRVKKAVRAVHDPERIAAKGERRAASTPTTAPIVGGIGGVAINDFNMTDNGNGTTSVSVKLTLPTIQTSSLMQMLFSLVGPKG